jgi:hypothetical protein
MRWSPAAIAGFAYRAGFTGEDLIGAVALALATSDGDDTYRLTVPGDTRGPYLGLWGVPAEGVEVPVGEVLFDPDVNARAARLLWTTTDRTFEWSPVWRSFRRQSLMIDAERVVRLNRYVQVAASHDDLARLEPASRGLIDTARHVVDAMRGAAQAILDRRRR